MGLLGTRGRGAAEPYRRGPAAGRPPGAARTSGARGAPGAYAPALVTRATSAIDEQVDKVLAVTEEAYRRSEAGTIPDDQVQAIEAIRAHRLTEALRQQRERRARQIAEIRSHIPEGDEWSPKDLPGDLGVQWAREQGRDRFLTLAGASVLIPPGRREDVGTIRIDIAHIAAWWPARFETGEEAAGDAAPEAPPPA